MIHCFQCLKAASLQQMLLHANSISAVSLGHLKTWIWEPNMHQPSSQACNKHI